MTLTDPTGGVGYAYGAKLPSTHMTSVTSQLPYAVDGNAGGTYAGNITLNGTITFASEPTLTAVTHTFAQCLYSAVPDLASSSVFWYTINYGSYGRVWEQQSVAGAVELLIPFHNLPNLGELKTCSVYIDGGSAHVGLPATKPLLTVYKRPISTGVQASIGSVSDAPADIAAYEAYHILGAVGGATPLALTAGNLVDGSNDYYAVVAGEAGANSIAQELHVINCVVTVECTTLTPG